MREPMWAMVTAMDVMGIVRGGQPAISATARLKFTIVNIHEAKTQLSRLVELAAKGDSFVIAKAGKPMVKVTALDAPAVPTRLGFLGGGTPAPAIGDGFNELPISSEHAVSMAALPDLHRDPFDRLLIAQATCEGITLVTADAIVAQYPGPIRKV